MNRTIKILLLLGAISLQLLFTPVVFARSAGPFSVGFISQSDGPFTYFNTTIQPPATCNLAGQYVKFDATTPKGKLFFTILLSAKLTGKTVNLFYTESMAPCVDATMSVLTGIAVN